MRSSRPASGTGPGSPDRETAAARRLAMLAADLGAEPTVDSAGDDLWWADHTRVVPQRPEDTAPAPTTAREAAPTLPRPGRHAARRRVVRVRDSVPGLGTAHLAVIALAVAVALAVTTWWLLRDRAEPAAGPAPTAMATSAAPLVVASSSSPDVAPSEADEGRVTVDVAGKVRRPGIVVLAAGARVVDALEAAGGARKGVDTSGINLARVLIDGEQIVVGAAAGASAPPVGQSGTGAASGSPAAPVNLNLADQAELETLPQVGPVTAAAIIAWRDEHGGFSSVEQLVEVDGIGEATLAQIAPHATV